MRISVLDASTLGEGLDISILEQFGECEVYSSTKTEEMADHAGNSDVIIINKIKLNPTNLVYCNKLKLICVFATGFDNIDLEYCRKEGIAVCNVVGYSTQSVAQLTVAMALNIMTHIPEYSGAVASGRYSDAGVANMLSPVYHEIYGKTWGIVGYGNIGRQVAAVARALGCRVIAYKRTRCEDVECVDIDTLCRESDIISIHTPLNNETRNLICADRIAMMKSDAIFINVARGAVVDEYALCEAVKTGKIGGIGIDVYSKEPFDRKHPYMEIAKYDNVCLTPHMAWGALEARRRCLDEICENICCFINGERRNRVD